MPGTIRKVFLLILFALFSQILSAQTREAGQVMFVSGFAIQELPDGTRSALVVGQKINPGVRIITRGGGYVHLRMIDDAYFSLRPNSQFVIEEYNWSPGNPEQNRLRSQLEKGSLRAITGRASQVNTQSYRLNTPIAAIGVRGTDFIAYHSGDATRVAVSSGTVVISPFNEGCAVNSVGACSSFSALTLTANVSGEYVEVRRNEALPELKKDGWSPQARKGKGETYVQGSSVDADLAVVSERDAKQAANERMVGAASETLEPSAFRWGRWGDPQLTRLLLDPAWQFQGGNVGFLLLQRADSLAQRYPDRNYAGFSLANSEARFRVQDGTWQQAGVTSGSLEVNFASGVFQTQLFGTRENELSWQLNAVGAVQPNGRLISNPFKSDANTWVNGAITSTASQAAYEFDKRYSDGVLVGITHWRNKTP